MSANHSEFEHSLQSAYQRYKAKHRLDAASKERIMARIESTTDAHQLQHGYLSRYRRFSYIKPAIISCIALVLILPLFNVLKEQTERIKPGQSSVVDVTYEENLIATNSEQPVRLALTLPPLPMNGVPDISFSEVATSTPEQKLLSFNQLVENLKQEAQSATQLVGLDFADEIRQGRLVQLDGDWFIEFCNEQRQLLRSGVIEQSLLASKAADQSNMTFDVYSNQNGVIALLQNTQPLMCD
ncbi:hypothetical protein [Thalassotalea mangrovi]|uniref:Uncharacterized protein n=1 Tax=Thalassotalea mangrovi TaxID=2572245 RepID=A0A4U1B233_9GAMM|nr:hypothetical protein [Thalassotalea mangrovi]TKB43644.1 hypothetical protein E8M12_14330 [Thalassotalea mangrovi]